MNGEEKKPRKKHVPKDKNMDVNLTFDELPDEQFDFNDEVIETYVNVKAKTKTIRILKDD
tara:strand:- start:3459 stop:3638 length:180 start_codon:yes stop_codon:yes gene_type:complete